METLRFLAFFQQQKRTGPESVLSIAPEGIVL
jgi:hypothetical protein